MSKSKVIILSFLLWGCTGIDKNKYVDEYSKFSCEELDREYRDVLSARVDAFNQKMRSNNINLVVNTTLGAISGHGKTIFNENSYSEQEAEAILWALRQVMHDKGCKAKRGSK